MLNDIKELPEECAYCGATEELTKEHVIPSGFAGKGAKNWEPVIVWACKQCNNEKSKLDQRIRALFAIDFYGGDHETAQKLIKGEILRSLQKGHSKDVLEFLASMKPETLISHDGEVLANGMGGKLKDDPFTPWFTFVVKGMAMALSSKRFDADASFNVGRYYPDGYAAIRQALEESGAPAPVRLGEHTIFSYRSVADVATGFGMWVFQFYGGVTFVVFVLLPEDAFDYADTKLES